MDQFVDTTEKARKDLDRKDKIEYLKNKNEDQLRQSVNKVRNSKSPQRSPFKSGY